MACWLTRVAVAVPVEQDVMIGPYLIKKGTTVRVSPYCIHHSEKYWESPEQWNPQRFADGLRDATTHKLAFLPFSAGKANCVGRNFALLEAKVMLTMIIQKLDLQLSKSYVHHPEFAITLRPKFGVPMSLRCREACT